MRNNLFLTLFTFLLFTNALTAANYYVSTKGSDSNNGAIGSPFATLQTAVNKATSGSDIIYLRGGTYAQTTSVNSKNGITITSYSGETVYLQGNGTSYTTIIAIANSSNITVSYLTIQNLGVNWAVGILVSGTGSNIQIVGNKVNKIHYKSGNYSASDNPGSTSVGANPIEIVGDNENSSLNNILISGNEVYNCMTGWCEGIALKGNVDNFNVELNIVHDITNIGIDAFGLGTYPVLTKNYQVRNGTIQQNTAYNCKSNYADNGALYVDGGKDISIINNRVYNNIYGITIGCENQINVAGGTTSGIHVRNNFVYNNTKAGIMIGTNGDEDGLQGDVTTSDVIGNTFLKNATSSEWEGELTLQNANNISVKNNIFYGLYSQMFTLNLGTSSIIFNYNDYYYVNGSEGSLVISQQTGASTWAGITLAQFKALVGGDAGSIFANPSMVSDVSSNGNFHINTSSPCVNAGDPSYSPFAGELDMDLTTRIVSSRIDMGCDETDVTTTVPVTGVAMSPTSASITVGGTQQLTATVAPSNATNKNVTWSSSNTSVATVSSTGLVTAVSAGSATITVITVDHAKTATCAVTVTSGGTTTITIDGSLSDWSSVSAIATATGQTCTSLKVYDDDTYFYFGIAGSGMNATNYHIFLNTDNNTATGYQDASFTYGSGAEYMIEGGGLFQSTGTGWSWASVSTTVTTLKNAKVTEVRVPRSVLGTLSSDIQVAYTDINDSWTAVSQLGYSSYTKLKSLRTDNGIGNSELSENISISPNPATDFLNIKLGSANGLAQINIYGIDGRIIYNEQTYESLKTINISDLKAHGLVLLQVTRDGQVSNFKVVLK